LDQVLPRRAKLSRGHHKAMAYADVPAFMTRLAAKEGVAARALEFTILDAARSGETLGGTWSEVDLDAATWTIPGKRMKAGREHRVPLPPRAVAILREMQALAKGKDSPLFPAPHGGALSSMAMSMTLRRMVEGVTVHGFRSSFRDWAADRTAFAHEVCEMALAHTIANKAEAAYRRGDLFVKRRQLMDAWAKFCATPAGDSAKVTPIRAARK
jgi:integrase